MTAKGAWELVRANLRRRPGALVLDVLGIALAVAAFVFFVALGTGVGTVVRERVFPSDASLLEVIPARVGLGSLLGGGKLDADTVTRLSRLPSVQAVHPKMTVRAGSIARFQGDFFGRPLRISLEVIGVGVDPALVDGQLAPGKRFEDPGPGAPIPAVIHPHLLELYNKSLADQRGLPHLGLELLAGFQLPVEWGRSFTGATTAQSLPSTLELAGLSPQALLGGVAIPLDAARRINRTLGQDDTTLSSVVLQLGDPGAAPEVMAAVRRMGLELDTTQAEAAERAGWAVALVTGALGLLSMLIAVLAAVNVARAFAASMSARRREWGILRAVGATRQDVLQLCLLEAGIQGAAGSGLGLGLAWLGSASADAAARRWLPPFPFQPESFFSFSLATVLAGLGIGVAAALLGAWGPAWRTATMEPTEALRET